jgi:hypothetical protein
MIVMAADTPDGSKPDIGKTGSPLGTNNPYRGSLTPAELAAEVGRWLQAQHPVSLQEALPEELASLVSQLGEREDGKTV